VLVAVEDYRSGSYTYDNDSVTTNLYLGNINPKVLLTFVATSYLLNVCISSSFGGGEVVLHRTRPQMGP